MLFAFSRDGAVPGAKYWASLSKSKMPVQAVLAVAVAGLVLTLPALFKVNIGTEEAPIYTVTAFFAVVSIGVLGLYLAFAIPIYYRWRAGIVLQAGVVEPGQQVEVDGTARDRRDPHHVASTSSCRCTPAGAPGFMRGFLGAPERRGGALRLEVRQLRAHSSSASS